MVGIRDRVRIVVVGGGLWLVLWWFLEGVGLVLWW